MNPNMTVTISNAFNSGADGNCFSKNGVGTVVLTGANTYWGPTFFNEGTLVAGAPVLLNADGTGS